MRRLRLSAEARQAGTGMMKRTEKKNLVSIVIPIYNVEGYLPQTLRSVAEQTYENIEVIMVDDGSTDGSSQVCARFWEHDSRFRYYRKDNGGLSSSRNFGMRHVQGDYVLFLDGDDLLARDAVEELVELAVANDVPMVTCAYKKIVSGEAFVGELATDVRIVTGKQLLEMMLTLENETGSAWAKLYRRQLCSALVFPEGQLFEDFGVLAELMVNVDRICISDATLYGYVTREGSITGTHSYGPRHIEGMTSSFETVKSIVGKVGGLDDALVCFEAICFIRVASKLDRGLCSSDEYYQCCQKRAKVAARKAVTNKKLGKVWRMRCLLYSISPKLHNVAYTLYGRVTGKVVA